MNLIDKLLCVDKAKAEEKETKQIKSKKHERLVGEDAEIQLENCPENVITVCRQCCMTRMETGIWQLFMILI